MSTNRSTRGLIGALLLALAAVKSSVALAAVPPATQPQIAVAYHGRIQDWRADGNTGIYVEGVDGTWYHADFTWSCVELPFTDHVRFVTGPDGSLDRFSSIDVSGMSCNFADFEPSSNPGVARS